MTQKRKMLSIVIPAYNEEKRIGNTLRSYLSFFTELKSKGEVDNFELLVVLNGCKDRTLDVVKDFKNRFNEIRYLNFEESGKGFAIIQGFKDALSKERELIGFVDADMATKPEHFYDLVKGIGRCDGIIASRGLRDSKVKTSFLRKLTNRGFNFVVRSLLFFPYKDTQCGAKLFKKHAVEKVINEIGMTQWAFDVDLLYKLRKKGFKIKEASTDWEDKKGTKLNLIRVPILMFLSIIRLRILNSPFKGLIIFYNNLPEWIKIYHMLK